MAGSAVSPDDINGKATNLTVQLRDLFAQVENFAGWMIANGGSAGLVTLGFSQADADLITSTINNHDSLRKVYEGAQAQPAPFDFRSNGQTLWAGQ